MVSNIENIPQLSVFHVHIFSNGILYILLSSSGVLTSHMSDGLIVISVDQGDTSSSKVCTKLCSIAVLLPQSLFTD